jgi:UDP-glucose 4-epimerase
MSESRPSILVTGGGGYIGGRLVHHLAGRGYPVRATFFNASRSGAAELPGAAAVGLDLDSSESCRAACKDMHSVVHCAAMNEIGCAQDPEAAVRINTLGTLKLVRAAEQAGVRRFVYFSTAQVYGAPLRGRVDEKVLTRPANAYGSTHRAAEDFVVEAHDRAALTGIVVRLSNSFGWPMNQDVKRWTLVVNDLCRRAVVERRLVLKTSGIQKRDFITLSDVCRGVEHLLSLAESRIPEPIFNLGGMATSSILEMAEKIARVCELRLGYRPAIEPQERSPGESAEDFDYRIDRILGTGFVLGGDQEAELSTLLDRCREWFGK